MQSHILTLIVAACLCTIGLASPAPSVSTIQARASRGDDQTPDKVLCNIQDHKSFDVKQIWNKALKEIDDYPDGHVPVDPHKCNRMFYRKGAPWRYTAIYVCNDNDHSIRVPVNIVHNYAVIITRSVWAQGCTEDSDDRYRGPGQAFNYNGGFNVILGVWNNDDK